MAGQLRCCANGCSTSWISCKWLHNVQDIMQKAAQRPGRHAKAAQHPGLPANGCKTSHKIPSVAGKSSTLHYNGERSRERQRKEGERRGLSLPSIGFRGREIASLAVALGPLTCLAMALVPLAYLLKILWVMTAWMFLGDIWDPHSPISRFAKQ